MQWIRAHRYTVALIAFAILVVTGGVVTRNNTRTGPERGSIENVSVEYPYYAPPIAESGNTTKNAQGNPQSPAQSASSSEPRILFFGNTAQPKETPMVQSATPKVPEEKPPAIQNTSFNDAYLFLFRTLSNVLSPAARTPEQQTLFDYGNAVGAIIKTFEDTHKNVTQTLKTFFDSRTDPSKAAGTPEIANAYAQLSVAGGATPPVSKAAAAAGVRAVAEEYAQLSVAIRNVRPVPSEAETPNEKLAKGYADIAQGLSTLSQAGTDAQMLDAISAYNTSADAFVKTYVSLVQLFSTYGVKFSASDPGAVFSFSAPGL